MTREEAIKFCDTVVDAINAMASLDNQFGIEIIVPNKDFHIYAGIFSLCDALGIDARRSFRDNKEWNVEVSFDYRGIKFYQLCHAKFELPDINSIELEQKYGEKLHIDDVDKPIGFFKDMQKTINEFDKATGNLHADLGTLGVVE